MKASSYPLQNIHTDKSEPYETKINDDSDSSAIYKSHKNIKLFKRLSANQKLFLPYLKPEKKMYGRDFFYTKAIHSLGKLLSFFIMDEPILIQINSSNVYHTKKQVRVEHKNDTYKDNCK